MKRGVIGFLLGVGLAAAAWFSLDALFNAMDLGKCKRLTADFRSIAFSLERYRQDQGGYPPGMMLKTFADTVPPEELDQLVSYLSGEVSLAEQLSNPVLHLVALMLLFNGGVWTVHRLAVRRAVATGESNA